METYRILLTRRSALGSVPQVFLSSADDGWGLPSFLPEHDIYNIDAYAANALVQAQRKIPVVTRQALRLVEPGLRSPLNVYVMECRDATDVPGPMLPGNWFGRDSLQEIAFVLPMERAVVAAWLAEAHGEDVPALAIPWWQEGWFATASAWLQTRAVALGRTVLAPVEQMRSAYTSAILRVLTDEGYLYLKVIPDALAQEITITQRLAQQDSDHFPTLLATTPDRMLLRDLGDRQPLGSHTSLARWEEIVRFYGELQVASVGSVPQWLAAGCLDLQTTHLAAQIQELIAHISERLQGLPQQLSGEERARLRTQESHLKALCEELAGYGVPDALEHGDLHAGNVALYATGFRLYDWSHACIMHPFYGFGSLFLDDDWFPEQPEALSRLRDAYLEAWTPYGSMPHLQAAFTLWQRLRPLFEAAHQSHVVATYQSMLGGNVYLSETATGNALQHMQWWLASHWRSLLHSSS